MADGPEGRAENTLSGRVRRYAQVSGAMGGLAARIAGARFLGISIDRASHAEELRAALGGLKGPLMKVASGGELARFLLALKVVLADRGSAPTLVFDEIDTGVGGAVADAIGVRLARLASGVQVLAVTLVVAGVTAIVGWAPADGP